MVSDLVLAKELPAAIKERTHPASSIQAAMMKDKYIETIEQAGFQDIKLVNEKLYCSFEDITDNPNAKIIVANRNAKIQESKSISKLDEKSKAIVKETLVSTMSISVSAIKPSSKRAGR